MFAHGAVVQRVGDPVGAAVIAPPEQRQLVIQRRRRAVVGDVIALRVQRAELTEQAEVVGDDLPDFGFS